MCQLARDWDPDRDPKRALHRFWCRSWMLHAAHRRARSRSRFARPHIWRLIISSLVMSPLVWPLDHGCSHTHPFPFDPIIINVHMPGISGLDRIRRFREQGGTAPNDPDQSLPCQTRGPRGEIGRRPRTPTPRPSKMMPRIRSLERRQSGSPGLKVLTSPQDRMPSPGMDQEGPPVAYPCKCI
jgi:CheY-like chemotaxis protein